MTFTHYVIIISVLIIGGIDIVLAITRGKDATISVVITKWSKQYPAIPFAFGFLMGHFFGQNK